MAYPQKLLAPDEIVKLETKPHWRAVIVPSIVLIATVFFTALLVSWILSWQGMEWLQWLRWVVIGGAIFILVVWAIGPFLRWLTTDYVFTDRRIIVRKGIITRTGKDMPLAKVNNVSFEVPALGRIFNYGALNIQSAGENDGLYISGVPDVEDIQRMVYELIEADEQRRRGQGTSELPPNSAS
jgi:membrane protein YdbS with pleckstrin-like domain